MILSFMIGVIFSPWSRGLLYYLIFTFILEAYHYTTDILWCPLHRVGLFLSGLLGFIVGRLLVGYHYPFDDPKSYR